MTTTDKPKDRILNLRTPAEARECIRRAMDSYPPAPVRRQLSTLAAQAALAPDPFSRHGKN